MLKKTLLLSKCGFFGQSSKLSIFLFLKVYIAYDVIANFNFFLKFKSQVQYVMLFSHSIFIKISSILYVPRS